VPAPGLAGRRTAEGPDREDTAPRGQTARGRQLTQAPRQREDVADTADGLDLRRTVNDGKKTPAFAARPCTGQVAGETANTPRNTRMYPPRSCYLYCMTSPIRGDFTGSRVQVPPRTRYFPRSAAGFPGQRRAVAPD